MGSIRKQKVLFDAQGRMIRDNGDAGEVKIKEPALTYAKNSEETKSEKVNDIEKLMGFSSFGSTQGKKVDGNFDTYAKLIKQRKYRQFMNIKKPLISRKIKNENKEV